LTFVSLLGFFSARPWVLFLSPPGSILQHSFSASLVVLVAAHSLDELIQSRDFKYHLHHNKSQILCVMQVSLLSNRVTLPRLAQDLPLHVFPSLIVL
jgi:hypothetical protein